MNKNIKKIKEEWVKKRSTILGTFNVGQHELLMQNGSVTMTAMEQRKEGEYNCRDAEIAVDETAKFFFNQLDQK